MNRPLPHDSAHTHVTGNSEFVDDRPRVQGELFVEVVPSPHAHARIVRIRDTKARQVPGVRGVFYARDFAHNLWGTIFKDQPLLAEAEVQFVGEPIALIAAETREAAARARELLEIQYEKLPAILSIDEARKKNSFIGSERSISRGAVERAWSEAPHQLKGRLVIRGADHFYLESQACIAYPREDGQIEVHSSSQHPTETQHVVAHGLGIPSKDVVCIVKRMGGAFGGKESQAAPFAAYAALVAIKLQAPARIVLTKDDDMVMTGKRNPFQNDYRVGFDSEGRILALDVELYSDGGAYADLSTSIMERAMLHCDNAYYIPNLRTRGRVCKTHFHPHTAFRGFGGPKGVATIEHVIEEIAHFLKKDALEIRKLNCYSSEGSRDTTHYGQKVLNNRLPELFSKLERSSDYDRRRKEISKHNATALERGLPLRGLSLTAVKFGISFTTRFLNQANALVHVHRDGTLQISTGATEMGQGVNARIAELCANELGLSRSQVRVMATSTEKNANTSPTAASSGTDLNGAAALIATRKIKKRLSHLAIHLAGLPRDRWAAQTAGLGTEAEFEVDANSADEPNIGPDGESNWPIGIVTYEGVEFIGGKVRIPGSPGEIPFSDLVNEAYLNRISLSEYAHYRFPHLAFDKLKGKGQAFLYYTQGTAASEVEIDPDTGECKVRRVDVLMDLGVPINAALDLGQVTGGFVQGMGWVTTEKLYYNSEGALVSHSPSTYKIPNIQDVPRDFRCDLLENTGNTPNVSRTKAAGEPPLLLAISVWTAIADAVRHAPAYQDPGRFPRLEIPAHQEQVLRAVCPERFGDLQ